jgi:site-specific DNA-methyltransferase (adenine-specific)
MEALKDLSKKQLIELCKSKKITGYSNKSIPKLIELIQQTDNVNRPIELSKLNKKTLIDMCKNKNISGISKKNKSELISLLRKTTNSVNDDIKVNDEKYNSQIICGDTINELPKLSSNSAQIILADPPYNIGKDFGNNSDKQPLDEYLLWCDMWLKECFRILKDDGTMFVYGFSEILALILSRIPFNINRRWIVWHYTNKNVASLNFWQRSHESILVLWKDKYVFNRDEIREPYTENFIKNSAGKERTATKGRFSKGDKKTQYNAHPNGALPRDVIKIPALAGGAGMKERVNHPTQKPLELCEKLIKSCCQSPTNGYVLVPFAGSGSECVASKNIGIPYIGIEINKEYVNIINERLS